MDWSVGAPNFEHQCGRGFLKLFAMLSTDIMIDTDVKGDQLVKVYLLKELFPIIASYN
jgi:hypothetical protein